MKAAEILELDTVTFIEPLFSALRDPVFTDLITQSLADKGRLLLDEHEDPIAVAFHETIRLDCRVISLPQTNPRGDRALRRGKRGDLPGRPCRMGCGSPGIFQHRPHAGCISRGRRPQPHPEKHPD